MKLFSSPVCSSMTLTRPPLLAHHHYHFMSSSSSTLPMPLSRNCNQKPRRYFRDSAPTATVVVKVTNQAKEECELVNRMELSIGEDSDRINAYLLTAVKNNNGVGILILSDIFGYEDSSTRDFAYRVACNGYNVLVPDMFRGDPWTKERPMTMLDNWIQGLDKVGNDITTSAKYMADEFVEAGISTKFAVIGFCFGGGRVIELLSQDTRSSFGLGVSFYGTRMDPSLASNVKVPVLFVSGDNDPLCSVGLLQDMEKKIEGSKVVVFEGRGHGFVHRPGSPEEDEDAENAFLILRNWLYDGLIAQK